MPSHPAYTLFMLLALAAFLITRHFVPKPAGLAALPWWDRAALAAGGFIGGALGAKLPFVFGDGAGPMSEGVWLQDGKTITTGLVGAYLGVELTKLVLHVRVKTGDTFALPLAVALAVGRWGCFCNGCCYGVVTELPWGVDFGDGLRRHPTQVYESVFHFLMAFVLLQLATRGLLPRQRLKFYLIAYGIYRFATEWIRPEPTGWLGLTFYQGIAVLMVAGLSLQWILDRPARAIRAKPLATGTPQAGIST